MITQPGGPATSKYVVTKTNVQTITTRDHTLEPSDDAADYRGPSSLDSTTSSDSTRPTASELTNATIIVTCEPPPLILTSPVTNTEQTTLWVGEMYATISSTASDGGLGVVKQFHCQYDYTWCASDKHLCGGQWTMRTRL